MTVEEIVNTWNVQLEQDATTFTNEAVKVRPSAKRVQAGRRAEKFLVFCSKRPRELSFTFPAASKHNLTVHASAMVFAQC